MCNDPVFYSLLCKNDVCMLIQDIIAFLEEKAPPPLQENYDNSGLIVGNKSNEVKSALISLDCTEAVIEEARAKDCNLIISHHPIVFSGLKRLNGNTYVERVVMAAIKYDIALYAIHTNLDNVHLGVNKKIADLLGLENAKILSPKKATLHKLSTFIPKEHTTAVSNALFAAGAGSIGNYENCGFVVEGTGSFKAKNGASPFVGKEGDMHFEPEHRLEVVFESYKTSKVLSALKKAHPYEEVAYYLQSIENVNQNIGSGMIGDLPESLDFTAFVAHLKSAMNLSVVKATHQSADRIKKVALCGGSGSFLLKSAIAQNADVYISSDFKYHEFFDADSHITIFDIGHYESEQFTIDLLHEWLREKFSTFALLKTEVITNPINYF